MNTPEDQANQKQPFDYIKGEEFENKLFVEELDHIKKQHPDVNKSSLFGLAFSGGGIRSATFSLGVMQALAEKGWLQKFHYLSTVSGGSYIGSSLTWLLHKVWKDGDKNNLAFDTGSGFPYKRFNDEPKAKSKSDEERKKLDQSKLLLRYLRQHGNYLTPGGGITGLSLLAVILRGTFLSLLVYIVPLIAAIIILNLVGFFGQLSRWSRGIQPECIFQGMNPSLCLALVPLVIFAGVSIYYGLRTSAKIPSEKAYGLRRKYEIYSRWLFVIAGLFLVLGSLPTAYSLLSKLMGAEMGAVAISSGGLLASVLSVLYSQKKDQGKIPLGLLAPVALIFMVYGVLLLAFIGAIQFEALNSTIKWFGFIVVLLSIWLGQRVNINYISIHRYYRDRLMELFMPNAEKLFNKESIDSANLSNEARLSDMCQFSDSASKEENKIVGPYHIINANMVTLDSNYMKLRARGGDNFILSPLYCGNAVTGWRGTKEYMGGDMSLATAMAISGAAADPHGAPGGEGLTRNWSLSLLMALLNVRLGFWAMNPDPKRSIGGNHFPNWFTQGKKELFGTGMDEKSPFVHLADGGHFENLALYELVRRRVKTIVVCDGAADSGYTFTDFANFVEKVRVDFGANVEMPSFLKLCPTPAFDEHGNLNNVYGVDLADRGYIIGDITYDDGSVGRLVYIKTTIINDLPTDIYGYKSGHPDFPDETTADQFFDEKQFEAYRELGYQIGLRVTQDQALKVPF